MNLTIHFAYSVLAIGQSNSNLLVLKDFLSLYFAYHLKYSFLLFLCNANPRILNCKLDLSFITNLIINEIIWNLILSIFSHLHLYFYESGICVLYCIIYKVLKNKTNFFGIAYNKLRHILAEINKKFQIFHKSHYLISLKYLKNKFSDVKFLIFLIILIHLNIWKLLHLMSHIQLKNTLLVWHS